MRRTASSISASLVVTAKLKRREEVARALGKPMARSVGESSSNRLNRPSRLNRRRGKVQRHAKHLAVVAGKGDVAGLRGRRRSDGSDVGMAVAVPISGAAVQLPPQRFGRQECLSDRRDKCLPSMNDDVRQGSPKALLETIA